MSTDEDSVGALNQLVADGAIVLNMPTDVSYWVGDFDHGNRDWAPVSVYFTAGGVRMATRFTISREAIRAPDSMLVMAEKAARATIIDLGVPATSTMMPAPEIRASRTHVQIGESITLDPKQALALARKLERWGSNPTNTVSSEDGEQAVLFSISSTVVSERACGCEVRELTCGHHRRSPG